jgi:ABC-type transporter Mla subunit MlaD
MIPYSQLTEQAKAQAIRDNFIILISKLANDRSKLKDYINPEDNAYKKIEEYLTNIKKDVNCACENCVDLNALNKTIPIELETLIDIAKKQAETKQY